MGNIKIANDENLSADSICHLPSLLPLIIAAIINALVNYCIVHLVILFYIYFALYSISLFTCIEMQKIRR